jgi:hypothetical protein
MFVYIQVFLKLLKMHVVRGIQAKFCKTYFSYDEHNYAMDDKEIRHFHKFYAKFSQFYE